MGNTFPRKYSHDISLDMPWFPHGMKCSASSRDLAGDIVALEAGVPSSSMTSVRSQVINFGDEKPPNMGI